MSRDPLEGVRPNDSGPPSFATGTPVSPTPVISSGAPARGNPKVLIFIVVGACMALGVAAAVFFQVDASQGPTPTPAATVLPAATPTSAATTENASDSGIRQLRRHSPDGSPDTPPANEMTTTPPKPKP